MALDPVPTWIHGAKHSGDILRQGTFNQTGGAEGVSSPTAFRVRATQTPSNQVRVDPGGLLMLSPWDEGQTYSMRNASETLVEVPASSSLSENTWYINAWVNDPNKPGGTVPVSTQFGPYNFLTCDPAPNNNNPAYACAQINVPKNEATIVQDYIEDLRELAQPRKDYSVFARPRIMEDEGTQIKLTSRYMNGSDVFWGSLFPGGSNVPNEGTIFLPSWATYMVISAKWMGIVAHSGENAWGRYWIEFGDEYREHSWSNGRQYEFSTQQFGFNTTGTTGNYRTEWSLDDARAIPAKLRGKNVKFAFKAGLDSAASTSGITMDYLGGLSVRVDYVQRPEGPDTI